MAAVESVFLVASDASATGLGYVPIFEIPGTDPTFPASRPLTTSERAESSTARGMLGVEFSLRTNLTQYAEHSVVFMVDNKGCPVVVRRGSPVPRLQAIAICIGELVCLHKIDLHMVWVPRSLNSLADTESRKFEDELHDWTISPLVFQELCSMIGWTPTIDLFATADNSQCERFYSRRHMFGSSGVNSCVALLPKHERFYACPPLDRSIPKFISRLPAPFPLILVVPHWPSRFWYTTILPRGGRLIANIPATSFNLGPNGRPYFLTAKQYDMTFDAFVFPAAL